MFLQQPDQLNGTQQIFIDWNARRLGLTQDQSFIRFRDSSNRLEGGYGGARFGTSM